jgi:hypothetical protein
MQINYGVDTQGKIYSFRQVGEPKLWSWLKTGLCYWLGHKPRDIYGNGLLGKCQRCGKILRGLNTEKKGSDKNGG